MFSLVGVSTCDVIVNCSGIVPFPFLKKSGLWSLVNLLFSLLVPLLVAQSDLQQLFLMIDVKGLWVLIGVLYYESVDPVDPVCEYNIHISWPMKRTGVANILAFDASGVTKCNMPHLRNIFRPKLNFGPSTNTTATKARVHASAN